VPTPVGASALARERSTATGWRESVSTDVPPPVRDPRGGSGSGGRATIDMTRSSGARLNGGLSSGQRWGGRAGRTVAGRERPNVFGKGDPVPSVRTFAHPSAETCRLATAVRAFRLVSFALAVWIRPEGPTSVTLWAVAWSSFGPGERRASRRRPVTPAGVRSGPSPGLPSALANGARPAGDPSRRRRPGGPSAGVAPPCSSWLPRLRPVGGRRTRRRGRCGCRPGGRGRPRSASAASGRGRPPYGSRRRSRSPTRARVAGRG
jgi:hypothetical protein